VNEVVRTKVELSRRSTRRDGAFEPVRGAVLSPFGLAPFLATHYRASDAVAQKIQALHGRALPQARDIFDLSLLFSLPHSLPELPPSQKRHVPRAVERAIGISFDEYSAQVVAFLDPEQAEPFASRDAWNLMQETVVERLEALAT
jgi:hypothetical protein